MDHNLNFNGTKSKILTDHVTNFIDTFTVYDPKIYIIKNDTINDFGKTYKIMMYEYNIFIYAPKIEHGIIRFES